MKTQAAAPITLTLLVLALGVGLSACTVRATLVIRSDSPRLRQDLAALAGQYPRSTGLQLLVGQAPPSPGVAVEIGWAFSVPGGASGQPIPDAALQGAGYRTALAFERWARGDAGWKALPLLWDAWGVAGPPLPKETARPGGAAGSHGTFQRRDRDALVSAGQSALAPLGDPGARQALYWFLDGALPPDAVINGVLTGGSERSSAAGLALFRSFAAVAGDPLFLRNRGNTRLLKADVENMARGVAGARLFGNYQWLRQVPSPGPRAFRTLAYALPEGYAIPASVLVGTVSGSGPAAGKARDFLLWLASPANQKTLSDASGYMAANFSAANLDPDARDARQAAAGAVRVVLVDPEPRPGSTAESWDSLLGRILAVPADWQRAVVGK